MVANKYAFLQITRRRFLNEWEAFKKVISRRNIRRRRSEERFSRNAETDIVCRLLLEKKKQATTAGWRVFSEKGVKEPQLYYVDVRYCKDFGARVADAWFQT